MAVGEFSFPEMSPLAGVRLSTGSAAIKSEGKEDLVVIELAAGSRISGVFTKNAFCAAPVTVARDHLQQIKGDSQEEKSYLVINSGNANACTGEQGLLDARETCAEIARKTGTQSMRVLPFSTGVIGESLPMQRILPVLPSVCDTFSESAWNAAARAVMTTDTRPKGISIQIEHEGEIITINGFAKGAGMIRPDMATMLAYVFTDARISSPLLDTLLASAVEQSFNRITVDGDTSTNDACILVATGRTVLPEVDTASGELYEKLQQAITEAHITLAQSIVTDGEGATKFITVEVNGGSSVDDCLKVAYSVAESPLVKTAFFAADPNWGRIVMAIGKAGVDSLDVSKINVYLNDVLIVESGERASNYREEDGQRVMNDEAILVKIELQRGEFSETVWTTDLSHDYVTINAEYRT